MYISNAQAETPYDLTNCYSGTLKDLYRSKELTIFAIESKGIAVSNHENRIFDNCCFQSVQVIQVADGKWKRFGHTTFIDPDGDHFLWRSLVKKMPP